jgi:multimeric flavodoxin WrbA
MTEQGWGRDEWPAIFDQVMAADILVLMTPIWLGRCRRCALESMERLYGNSAQLTDKGQYADYGQSAASSPVTKTAPSAAHENPLLAAAPRLHDSATSRRRLGRRGGARLKVTSMKAQAGPTTASRTATPRS